MISRHALRRLVRFLAREDGPTAVEYAVMLALIVTACIGAITAVGGNANSSFGKVFASGSGGSGGAPAVGAHQAGGTAVPTGEIWTLNQPNGAIVTYNSTTGVETTTNHPNSQYNGSTNNSAGQLTSDRGVAAGWTRTQ